MWWSLCTPHSNKFFNVYIYTVYREMAYNSNQINWTKSRWKKHGLSARRAGGRKQQKNFTALHKPLRYFFSPFQLTHNTFLSKKLRLPTLTNIFCYLHLPSTVPLLLVHRISSPIKNLPILQDNSHATFLSMHLSLQTWTGDDHFLSWILILFFAHLLIHQGRKEEIMLGVPPWTSEDIMGCGHHNIFV